MSKIIGPQFKPAEFMRTVYYATPEAGITAEDMLEPSFWAHVAGLLKRGDRIEAVSAEGDWYAEFFVKTANKTEAYLTLMRRVQLTKAKPEAVKYEEPEYVLKHSGKKNKWTVTRTKDKQQLSKGHEDKDAAQAWLDQYLADIESSDAPKKKGK